MVGFSAFMVGPGQDGHLAAARRDTLQSRRPIGRGKHDRVLVQPRQAAHRPIDSVMVIAGPPFNATLMSELPSVYTTELTVWGEEQSSDVVAADERPWLEFVERPHQELRLVVADVYTMRVPSGVIVIGLGSRAAGEHDRRADDAWGLGSHRPPCRPAATAAATTTAAGTARRRPSPGFCCGAVMTRTPESAPIPRAGSAPPPCRRIAVARSLVRHRRSRTLIAGGRSVGKPAPVGLDLQHVGQRVRDVVAFEARAPVSIS